LRAVLYERVVLEYLKKVGELSRGPTSCYWNLKSEGLWKFKIYNNNKELNTENTIAVKDGIITVTNDYSRAPASKERPTPSGKSVI
jgi:hypothetical protein